MRPHLTDIVAPAKFAPFLRRRRDVTNILDVGCANNSARQARRWFPNARYSAVDIDASFNGPDIDCFYHLNLDTDNLESIPNGIFDLILFVHVIEHLRHGESAIQALARKLAPGGAIYIETPSERSVEFCSAVGTLNFYDDPTHIRLYSRTELAAAVKESGLEVRASGIARSKAWMAMGATIFLPVQAWSLVRSGRPLGPALWDWMGFRAFVLAVRP